MDGRVGNTQSLDRSGCPDRSRSSDARLRHFIFKLDARHRAPGSGPSGPDLSPTSRFFTKKVVKTAESRAVGCAAAARGRRGTRGTARGGASRGRRRERFTEWEVMRKIVFVAQFPFSPSLCNLTTHEMNCVAFRLRRVCAPVRLTCRHQTFNNYVTA